MADPTCPKCSRAMTRGFVVDEGYGVAGVSTWQDGDPRKSFWTGVKQLKDEQHEIVTWRCTGCGYLESYAP